MPCDLPRWDGRADRLAKTPTTTPPAPASQFFAILNSLVWGDNSIDLFLEKYFLANASSFFRRSESNESTTDLPRSSTSKSKTISLAGVSLASFLILLAAG